MLGGKVGGWVIRGNPEDSFDDMEDLQPKLKGFHSGDSHFEADIFGSKSSSFLRGRDVERLAGRCFKRVSVRKGE